MGDAVQHIREKVLIAKLAASDQIYRCLELGVQLHTQARTSSRSNLHCKESTTDKKHVLLQTCYASFSISESDSNLGRDLSGRRNKQEHSCQCLVPSPAAAGDSSASGVVEGEGRAGEQGEEK